MNPSSTLIPSQQIEQTILLIRGQKVMLDFALAGLYGVETRALKQAVRRNLNRFPEDFMFVLNEEECSNLRSQIVISSSHGGLRYAPMAFSEQGVAMLSSVLKSERAALVNVAIMHAFVRLRKILSLHKDLARKLAELERNIEGHDASIHSLFDAIRQLMTPPPGPRKEIGFHVKEDAVPYRVKRPASRSSIPSKPAPPRTPARRSPRLKSFSRPISRRNNPVYATAISCSFSLGHRSEGSLDSP